VADFERPGHHGPGWLTAIILFGAALTAAWVGLLGYGLIKLVEHVI
jgi:hypothetical protein